MKLILSVYEKLNCEGANTMVQHTKMNENAYK